MGTDPDAILPALRCHLDLRGFQNVEIIEHDQGMFHATRLDVDHRWVKYVDQSIARTTRQSPHILPNLAGGLPNDIFSDLLGLPTIWIPHSYLGCSQHAPDEHVLKPVCQEGLRIMAGLFWDLGDENIAQPRSL